MNENILSLLQKLDKDEKLLNEFTQKRSIDELYDFSLSIVKGYTKQEFVETMKSIADKLYSNPEPKTSAKTAMSDSELDNVNGGISFSDSLDKIFTVFNFIGNTAVGKFNSGFALGQQIGKQISSISDIVKN